MAWLGMAGLGRARQGEARRGRAWRGEAGLGAARQGEAGLGRAGHGKAWQGRARLGTAGQELNALGIATGNKREGHSMNDEMSRLHNKLAGEIVASIVKAVVGAGGNLSDILVLTESVIVGVALAVIKLGGDDKVLDVMLAAAKERLAEIRLRETRGSA